MLGCSLWLVTLGIPHLAANWILGLSSLWSKYWKPYSWKSCFQYWSIVCHQVHSDLGCPRRALKVCDIFKEWFYHCLSMAEWGFESTFPKSSFNTIHDNILACKIDCQKIPTFVPCYWVSVVLVVTTNVRFLVKSIHTLLEKYKISIT